MCVCVGICTGVQCPQKLANSVRLPLPLSWSNSKLPDMADLNELRLLARAVCPLCHYKSSLQSVVGLFIF